MAMTLAELANKAFGTPEPSAPKIAAAHTPDNAIEVKHDERAVIGNTRGWLARACLLALQQGPADRHEVARRAGLHGGQILDRISGSMVWLRRIGKVDSTDATGMLVFSLTDEGRKAAGVAQRLKQSSPQQPSPAPAPLPEATAPRPRRPETPPLPSYRDLAVEALRTHLEALRAQDARLNRLMLAVEHAAAEQGEPIWIMIE